MKKFVRDFELIANKRINREYYLLVLKLPDKLPELFPGQFVEIRIDNSNDTFLRRPISLYDVDYEKHLIYLLIQEVGKGTRKLAGLKVGDKLNLIYPLGNSFSLPGQQGKVLLVGGGVGVAPLLFLARFLTQNNVEPEFLLGFRNNELLVNLADFEKFGKVHLSTDDGSEGEAGTVMDHSLLKAASFPYVKVYTCGPQVMMKAVGSFAEALNVECEASLENTMACGFGACLCCIQETVRGNLRVCKEGPVFNTIDLIW